VAILPQGSMYPMAGQHPPAARADLRRGRGNARQRVTNIELFFDLVYIFAITQLSHYVGSHLSLAGMLRAGLLLAMVWLLWAYTTWVTNWLDPDHVRVRLLLLALMLVGLAMSAALPQAFDRGSGLAGLLVGCAYAVMQIGRSLFAVLALPPGSLRRNFQRILAWCCLSGGCAVAGGLLAQARAPLWLAAVAIDLLGGAVGFWTPWLGRSRTSEWNIEGGHFAERCQAFILIALGESIVVTGAALAGLWASHRPVGVQAAAAFCVAFVGSAGLWWLYFDRSAEAAAQVIARSADPGRLGRSAYHLIHPIMVAGIIVIAAADRSMLARPAAVGVAATAWLILGGNGLYIAGHAAFKAVVWRELSWPRLAALAALGLLGLAAPHVSALVLGSCAAAVVLAVAAADAVRARRDRAASAQAAA
jgi:low temperature requirement protein LtrA